MCKLLAWGENPTFHQKKKKNSQRIPIWVMITAQSYVGRYICQIILCAKKHCSRQISIYANQQSWNCITFSPSSGGCHLVLDTKHWPFLITFGSFNCYGETLRWEGRGKQVGQCWFSCVIDPTGQLHQRTCLSLSLCLSAGCRATKSLHTRAWLGAMEMIVAELVEFRVLTHAVSEQRLEQVSFRQFLSFTVGWMPAFPHILWAWKLSWRAPSLFARQEAGTDWTQSLLSYFFISHIFFKKFFMSYFHMFARIALAAAEG